MCGTWWKIMKRTVENTSVLLGIPVSRLNTRQTLDSIFEMTARKNEAQILVTVNVDFMVNTHRVFRSVSANAPLLSVMRASPLVSADGMPIVLLSRLLGDPLPERVAGADLVPLIAERAARENKTLYFLGGSEENARAAADLLRTRYPGLRIAGVDSPFVSLDDSPENERKDRAVCDRINAASPDILLIGFGNPKQELWARKNRKNLHVPLMIGVGGTFNFICGAVRRAPEWMRKTGTEWIYRIIQEPGRLFRRYAVGFFVYGALSMQAFGAHLIGLCRGKSEWKEPVEEGDRLVLDCSCLRRIDRTIRFRMVEAHVRADSVGKKLMFEHLGFLTRIQLKGHRLFD